MQNSIYNFCVRKGNHIDTHTHICADYLLIFVEENSGKINQKLLKVIGEELHSGEQGLW